MAVDYATLKEGGFMRQKQKNNFSLRIRVVGGTLTAKQLAVVSEVAETYGKGYVHLTSRQGVVIPFIEDHDKLMKVCDAAIDFFADHANAGERFKFTIDRVGSDKFEQAIREAYENE